MYEPLLVKCGLLGPNLPLIPMIENDFNDAIAAKQSPEIGLPTASRNARARAEASRGSRPVGSEMIRTSAMTWCVLGVVRTLLRNLNAYNQALA